MVMTWQYNHRRHPENHKTHFNHIQYHHHNSPSELAQGSQPCVLSHQHQSCCSFKHCLLNSLDHLCTSAISKAHKTHSCGQPLRFNTYIAQVDDHVTWYSSRLSVSSLHHGHSLHSQYKSSFIGKIIKKVPLRTKSHVKVDVAIC